MVRGILVLVAVLALARATIPWVDGSFDNGELVDGTLVGPVRSRCVPTGSPIRCGDDLRPGYLLCQSEVRERCVTSVEATVAELFPDGPPSPVVEVTFNDDPPPLVPWEAPPTYLAGHSITVVRLADGTARVRVTGGTGKEYEFRPKPTSSS